MSSLCFSRVAGGAALVTGGSRGIGAAISHALARAGMPVAVAARNVAVAEELVHSLPVQQAQHQAQQQQRHMAVACNVADAGAVDATVAEVEKKLGTISVLINCAGGVKLSLCLCTRHDSTIAACSSP